MAKKTPAFVFLIVAGVALLGVLPVLLPMVIPHINDIGKTQLDQQRYPGEVVEAKGTGQIKVGDQCQFQLTKTSGLVTDMVHLLLECGGTPLYGHVEGSGYVTESKEENGRVVHALDKWDDDGDPGIEFKASSAEVAYWQANGVRASIALDNVPGAATRGAPQPGAEAASTLSPKPGQRGASPDVHDCSPGQICLAPRFDVSF